MPTLQTRTIHSVIDGTPSKSWLKRRQLAGEEGGMPPRERQRRDWILHFKLATNQTRASYLEGIFQSVFN
jgi:hypothetical protein